MRRLKSDRAACEQVTLSLLSRFVFDGQAWIRSLACEDAIGSVGSSATEYSPQ